MRLSGARMTALKPLNSYFDSIKTTIFSVMSALAVEHKAVNLGQVKSLQLHTRHVVSVCYRKVCCVLFHRNKNKLLTVTFCVRRASQTTRGRHATPTDAK